MEELKDKNKVKNVLANTSNSNFETIKNNLLASSDSNSEKELIKTLTNAPEEGAPQNVLGESSETKVENKKKEVTENKQIEGGQEVSYENSEGLLSKFKELKSDKEKTDELKMKKKELCESAKISHVVLTRMAHGESVTTDSILKICMVLDCRIEDIMEIVEDDSAE